MTTRVLAYFALVVLMMPTTGFSCGESLYRVGRGVAYRTYSAPLPGNLLFLASTPQDKEIAQQLADAGHQVLVVSSPASLVEEIRLGGHDIVIAPFDQRQAVEDGLGSSAVISTRYLPVATSRQQKREAGQAYVISVSQQGELKDYLKAIHRTLKLDA